MLTFTTLSRDLEAAIDEAHVRVEEFLGCPPEGSGMLTYDAEPFSFDSDGRVMLWSVSWTWDKRVR